MPATSAGMTNNARSSAQDIVDSLESGAAIAAKPQKSFNEFCGKLR
jgi:hypothetical protein